MPFVFLLLPFAFFLLPLLWWGSLLDPPYTLNRYRSGPVATGTGESPPRTTSVPGGLFLFSSGKDKS